MVPELERLIQAHQNIVFFGGACFADAFPNGHADHLPKSIAKNLRVYKMIKIT